MQAHAYERVLLTEAALRVKEGERRARLEQSLATNRPASPLHKRLVALVHSLGL